MAKEKIILARKSLSKIPASLVDSLLLIASPKQERRPFVVLATRHVQEHIPKWFPFNSVFDWVEAASDLGFESEEWAH